MIILHGMEDIQTEGEDPESREIFPREETEIFRNRPENFDGEDTLRYTGQDMQKRAKLRCMHLLERKDYTERELRRKLELGRTPYTQDEIDTAIAYVKSYHYVDDARYASRYIDSMSARKSRWQMEQELLRRGIDRTLIAQAFEEAEEIPEEAQIADWMRRRHFDPTTADQGERRRMYAFLARRGFEPEMISRALR